MDSKKYADWISEDVDIFYLRILDTLSISGSNYRNLYMTKDGQNVIYKGNKRESPPLDKDGQISSELPKISQKVPN